MIGQKLYDKREASAVLHISVSLLDHLTASRLVGHLKLGHKCYYTDADLESYMATRRVESTVIGKPSPSKASAAAAAPGRRRAATGA